MKLAIEKKQHALACEKGVGDAMLVTIGFSKGACRMNSSDDSDSDQSQVIFHQQLLSLGTTVPIPSIKLQILPSKFQRPVPAIGLIDTGAQQSMLNPHLLPPEYWTDYEEHFKAVNGKLFTTSLITKKPIGIQIFPNCVIWTKVIGSTLPNKDLLLGFDILHQIKHLQILPTGIRVKSMFKPFTDILKLYNLSETPQSYQDISTKLLSFCPESHSEFTHPNPLWKRSHDEHRQLLTQFYDIVQSHGIMLSAKKCTIATDNIEFLGMIIKDGHYEPGKHIAQELLHFPDQQLSRKQVQQFLGIINYIRDFIPHVDRYTHHLSALLKKKPPEWNADHTNAVTTLKQIAQNPPPLKLITDGKRILQTDASDDSWGAILLEDINRKEHFIAYASGQFSDTQKHYHIVFKEIRAVKNGIKKFEYHLIGHHFLIQNPFLTGLTLDPSRETTADVLWYIWCLTVLYATKLVLPITPTLEHLLNPDKATSLTWTLLEWFSPIPWWRKKLQHLSEIYNLERMPAPEAQLFTSVFIIHRPYFQHPDTNLFWTQDQVYEWFTAPHPAVIENEIQDVLHNYLCQLNHQPPPLKDIFHTSLGPQHDLLMIPTPSAISKPKSTGIIIKEERPDYTDFLYQDSQDLWEDFLPLSQYLQQFPQPSMNEPGSSSQPPKGDTATKPSKVDKATQTSPGYRQDCPYPLCRGLHFLIGGLGFLKSIRTLISTRRPHPKEYILSSRLDQCALQATSAEQYVTLEIPSELLSNWKREGYTHLHLGGIRLILTLHGRKGLPVTARLAMLDIRFKQYQHAVIGTVLTTLHAAESDQIPTIIQIPRQILRHELIKLMPLEWISNYEQFHNNTTPIQTSESMFERRQDGTVRMTFKPPPSAPQEPHRLSFTYSSMITAVQTAQEDLSILGLNSEGYPVYPAKQHGHFLWDAPGSGMCDPNCPCWDDWDEDDDYATTRKKKPKKKKSPVSCHHCDPKPPQDPPPPPAPLPFYRKELKWIAKHCKSETPSPIPLPTPPLTCMMFSSTSSDYSSFFPPLDTHTDSQRNVVSKPFVPSPITSSGHLEPPKPFESVLNWQTQNARAQNDTLLNINSKEIHHNLQSRITQLDSELRAMLAQRYYGPEFDQKESEIRRLEAELAQIESKKQRPTLFTTSSPIPSIGPPYHPFASMLSPIRQYDPSKLFGMTHTLFRDNPLPPPPKPKPKPKPQPRPVTFHPPSITIPGQHSPGHTPASPPVPPPPTESQPPSQSKDKKTNAPV
ncbi:hypothetical protein KPL71_001179 [Citrus sinensis]|uniref:Uncharacterized protein n=1 Tax=Citrus sinensis TaxID=2711 RepID=A0ACB8NVK0_CITSI|nr:hypothetical protein KPL71_001179 [Citrus sinensis]